MKPRAFSLRAGTRWQRGIAAVELALIISSMVITLIPTFLIAHGFWQYTVLKHATYDAGRYLAAVPLYQITETDPSHVDLARALAARAIVAAGAVPAASEADIMSHIEVTCPGTTYCRLPTAPTTIEVKMYMTITHPLSTSLEGNDWLFGVSSSVRYEN